MVQVGWAHSHQLLQHAELELELSFVSLHSLQLFGVLERRERRLALELYEFLLELLAVSPAHDSRSCCSSKDLK